MPAIAQRATIENQEVLLLEWDLACAPAAPLNVITGVWKIDIALLRGHALRAGGSCIMEVRAREQRCSQLKQVRIITRITVRESGNPAVRAMAVHGEFAGAFQSLVILARKAEAKPADILARAQIRPEHHHVVVR